LHGRLDTLDQKNGPKGLTGRFAKAKEQEDVGVERLAR
jgi:hypothetical protein